MLIQKQQKWMIFVIFPPEYIYPVEVHKFGNIERISYGANRYTKCRTNGLSTSWRCAQRKFCSATFTTRLIAGRTMTNKLDSEIPHRNHQ